MSENEEIKTETKGCNCDKKELSRFLLMILGSFFGCLLALCLFSAVKKPQPPMPVMPMMPPQITAPYHHHMDCNCPCHRHHGEFRPDRKHHPDMHRPARPDRPDRPVKKDIKK